jgi:hypothetical protein
MWAGVCLSGRGDSDAEAEADADAVGRVGGDFAGRTTSPSLGSGALLVVVVLLLAGESVVDGASLIEHASSVLGGSFSQKGLSRARLCVDAMHCAALEDARCRSTREMREPTIARFHG